MIIDKIKSILTDLKSNTLTSNDESLVSFQNLTLHLNQFKSLEINLIKSSFNDLNSTLVQEILEMIEFKLNQINKILNHFKLTMIQVISFTSVIQFISRCICVMIKNKLIPSFSMSMKSILNSIESISNQKKLSSSDVLINLGISWSLINQNVLNNSLISLLEFISSKQVVVKIQLTYLNGCLTELSDSNLVETVCKFKNGRMMNLLFENDEKSVDTNVIQARVYYQLTRLLLNHDYDQNEKWLVQLIKSLQTKVFEKLHSPIDIIRNISFDSFQNLIILDSRHDFKYIESLLIDFKLANHDHLSVQFHVFCILTKVLKIEKIISLFPDFINRIFFLLNNCNEFANYTIELIIEIIKFDPSFINQLLKSISSDVLITQLFPKLIKKSPNLMHQMAHLFIIYDFSIHLKIRLKTLQLISFDLNSNSDERLDVLIIQSLTNFDESIQICSASLIIESKKSTQSLLAKHLIWLQNSFPTNLRLSQSYHQKSFINLIKKLFNRLVFSLKSNGYNQDRDQLKLIYTLFVQNIINSCLVHLHGSCNSVQRYLILQILKLIVSIIGSNDYFDLKTLFLKSFESQAIYSTIINCLIEDTREDNKSASLDLIVDFFKLKIIQSENIDLSTITKNATTAISSINPCDFSSGVYLFKLLLKLTILVNSQSISDSYFDHLNSLIKLSQESIEQADQSIVNAAVFNPLHNKLACIRGLIEDFDWCLVQPKDLFKWKKLIEKLIMVCFQASQTVEPIVCNQSPEGHLPMDMEPIDEKVFGQCFGHSVAELEKRQNITSQMLLICGWKTIKESTFILGNLCNKIKHSQDKSLMTCSQIVLIIKYFINNLKELVHRGAFEQASVGFSLVIQNLWTSPCFCFRSIQQLLHSIIGQIELKDSFQSTTITTRRSAGLPFIIQAIVSSEPDENQNVYLYQTVSRLIFFCQSPNVQKWQLIHSLNILSALIKDHKLSTRIVFCFEDCLIICFENMSSSCFGISNSASLLFVALVTKIFGISSLSHCDHKKSLMSSKHFFLQFPSLNDFITLKLKDHQNRHLYFILLILVRLQPSSREPEFQMTHFLPDLINISTLCKLFRIRELSSKVVAQIICSNEKLFLTTLTQLFGPLSLIKTNSNFKHGGHLILNKSIKNASNSFLIKLGSNILNLFNSELDFLNDKLVNNSSASFCVSLNHYYLIVSSIQVLTNRSLISTEHSIFFKLEEICFQLINKYIQNPQNLYISTSQNFLIQLFYTCLYNPFLSNFQLIQSFQSSNLPRALDGAKFQLYHFVSHNLLNKSLKNFKLQEEAYNDFEINIEKWKLNSSTSFNSSFNYETKIKYFLSTLVHFSEFKMLISSKITNLCSERNIIQMLLIVYSNLIQDNLKHLHFNPKTLLNSLMITLTPSKNLIHQNMVTYVHLCISSIFYSMIKNNHCIDCDQFYIWSIYLMNLSEPHSSDLNRCMVTDGLNLILPLITVKKQKELKTIFSNSFLFIKILINFFRAAINLIQDNEMIIRKKMHLLFKLISKETDDTFSCLEKSFKIFHRIFDNFESIPTLIHVIIDMMRKQIYQELSEESNDEGLFTKSKLNTYKDELYFIQVFENNLENIIKTVDCQPFHEKFIDESNNLDKFLDSNSCVTHNTKFVSSNFQNEFKVIRDITIVKLWLKCSKLCEKCGLQIKSIIQNLNHPTVKTVLISKSLKELKLLLNSENFSKKTLN